MESSIVDHGGRNPSGLSIEVNKGHMLPCTAVINSELVGATSEGGKRRPGRPRKKPSILLRGYASESGINEVGEGRHAGPFTHNKATSSGLLNAFQILSNEEFNMEC